VNHRQATQLLQVRGRRGGRVYQLAVPPCYTEEGKRRGGEGRGGGHPPPCAIMAHCQAGNVLFGDRKAGWKDWSDTRGDSRSSTHTYLPA